MVFLNYSTMQMVAKIVYYGPGLGGKTTNLKTIYKNTATKARGEMVSLATETDRTLFFDLLPMEVGIIGGFKTKFQLYTVPGQVFYNTTRKLVLRGVDGIVFVADSQVPMMDANLDSFQNLRENLEELNLNIDDIPFVFQYNKRDLPNVVPIEQLNAGLNPFGRPYLEASALNGVGVFETLREISKQTLMVLNAKSLSDLGDDAPPARGSAKPANKGSGPATVPDLVAMTAEDAGQVAFHDFVPEGDDRDGFEKTLDNLELDFSEDDGFIEEDSLDMDGVEEWEHTGSTARSSNAQLEETLGDQTDPHWDTNPGAGAHGAHDDLAEIDDIEIEGDDEPRFVLAQHAVTDFEPSAHPREPYGEASTSAYTGADMADEEDDQADALNFDMMLPEEPALDRVEVSGQDSDSDHAAFLLEEDAEETEEAIEEMPTEEAPASIQASRPPEVVNAPRKHHEQLAASPAKARLEEPQASRSARIARKTASADLDSTIQELETFSRSSKTATHRIKTSSVSSLMDGLVSDKKDTRFEKHHIQVPGTFAKAQLNCVFLDEEDNVVHAHLIKVKPRRLKDGRYNLRVSIDIEPE